jgi:hypothetical protein
MLNFITKLFDSNDKEVNKLLPIVAEINSLESKIKKLKDQDFPKRTAELKKKVQEASTQVASDFFQLAIDLLGQDEKARKKHGAAIKAFSAANVFVQGLAEVQKIWAHAADLGPIAGPIIGALQTAVAVGRTVLAIGKINATKFAQGNLVRFAKWGMFGGKPHSAGGTKGFFDDGTAIEVEKDEAFAVVNKQDTPLLRALSAINSVHGVPFFARGAKNTDCASSCSAARSATRSLIRWA